MAEKNIQMQRKNADGTFDLHFPLTKVENVAGAAKDDDLIAHQADYVRQPAYSATGGTATAYTATLDPAPANIVEGFSITIVPHATCGANPTLNVNGKGAIQLRNSDNEQLSAGDLVAGRPYNFRKVGSYFFLSSGGGGVKIEFDNYFSSFDDDFTHSTATNLSATTSGLAGASVGDYALFAGGSTNSGATTTITAYNSALTRSTPTGLSVARWGSSGGSVGNYAVFAGGYTTTYVSTVDAFNSSLTRFTPTAIAVVKREIAAASVGNYVVFAGGLGHTGAQATVDAYNASLVRSTPTALSDSRRDLGGASVLGDYAIFAGGQNSSYANSNVVDAYDSSLTRSTPTTLSAAVRFVVGASTGNHALFAAQQDYSMPVNAYDDNLTRVLVAAAPAGRQNFAGASARGHALFAGGSSNSARVDAYNMSLVHLTLPALATGRSGPAGSSVGNYTIFAGGMVNADRSAVVDAYYNTGPKVFLPITAGSKYSFNGEAEQTASSGTTLTYDQPITGYIKYKKGVI